MNIKLNHVISETKPGEKFDKDLNKLLKGLPLKTSSPSKQEVTKIDISKIFSPVLNDMFVVLEIECFYPIHFDDSERTLVAPISAPLDHLTSHVFKTNLSFQTDLYKFKRKLFDIIIKDNPNVKDELETNKEYQFFFELESNSNLNNEEILDDVNFEFNQLLHSLSNVKKFIDIKSISGVSFNDLRNPSFNRNEFFKEKFGREDPSIAVVLAKYHLELYPGYSWNTDKTKILISSVNDEEKSFLWIVSDLKRQFKGTLFNNNKVTYIEKPKSSNTTDKSIWYVTSDSSLREIYREKGLENYKGVEIITRAIPFSQLREGLEFISNLFTQLKIITNDDTSLHANIGFKTKRGVDLLKVVVLTNDERELIQYNRQGNTYTLSQLGMLRRNSEVNSNALQVLIQQSKAFDKYSELNLPSPISYEKYNAINFKKWLYPKEGYDPVLEFRIIGGKNYLPNYFQDVLSSLKRYFAVVAVSGDSEIYQKDYLHKLGMLSLQAKDEEKKNTVSQERKTIVQETLDNIKSLIKNSEVDPDDLGYFKTLIYTLLSNVFLPLKFSEFNSLFNPVLKELYSKPYWVEQLRLIRDVYEKRNRPFFEKFKKIFFKLK